MCNFCGVMQRYTSLLWNSDKKTVLGKNGVSWMSILLGTLVIVLIVGVFINSILEVKYARQEKEAKMRKMILEKKRLFTQYGIFDIKNKRNNTSDMVRVKFDPKTKPQKFPVSPNIPEGFLENEITAEKYENFRDLPFLLRSNRNTTESKIKSEQANRFTESISSNVQDTSLDEEYCSYPDEEQVSVSQKVEKHNGIEWSSLLVGSKRNISGSKNTMVKKTISVESANKNYQYTSLDAETCTCPKEEIGEIPVQNNKKHNVFKWPALFLRGKRDISGSKNTTVQDTLSIESTNDQIPSVSLSREDYSHPIETENMRKPVSFIMTEEPYLTTKKRNEIDFRPKRQYYPAYTDRTPILGYENQIEKFTKRENGGETWKTSDSQHSFVVSHETKSSDAIRQRTKRNAPSGITNFFRKFITALKPKSTNDVYGRAVKAAETEDTYKQSVIKMTGKYNILIPKNETTKRISIVKLFNKFANTKLERLQKRNTIAKLIVQQTAEGKDLNTTVEVKNTNKFKISIFFDNIDDTNLDRFKRNSRIVSDATEVFDKNIGVINKDQSTSFLEKLARAKIERLKRSVPIYTTLTDVFDKSASEKNDTVQDGPNSDDYVINLSLGAGPLFRNRRV